MRTLRVVAALAAFVVLAADPVAAQQDPQTPARISASEAHHLRGALAWRIAVWTGDRDALAFAARELEQALLTAERRDFSTLFLLACSRAASGDVAGAVEPARDAFGIAPEFPGHLLLDAGLGGVRPRGDGWRQRVVSAVQVLEKYQIALASYDRSAAFAAELEYLGHFEKGVRLVWLDLFDRAILDFDRAAQIARAQGRTPSAELLRRLSQCHKELKQFDMAERMIRGSLERQPGEPSHYQVLGQLAADREKRAEASDWYRKALARKLDYAEPRAKLAYLANEAGDLYTMRVHIEALRAIHETRQERQREALEPGVEANIHSAFGQYWLAKAESLADAGRLEEARRFYVRARRDLETALALEPGCVRALNSLIRVLYQLEAPEDEIRPLGRRLDDILKEEPSAPKQYNDTFC